VTVAGNSLRCDISTGRSCAIILEVNRQAVFKSLHGLAHPGIWATWRLLSARMVWPHMTSDIAACNRQKSPGSPPWWSHPSQFWSPDTVTYTATRYSRHVHVDLVPCQRPLMVYFTFYLFTIINHYTSWLEVIPLRNMSTISWVDALLQHWIPRFGFPATLTSERGRQFASTCGVQCAGI
jgi:hypothetical protein